MDARTMYQLAGLFMDEAGIRATTQQDSMIRQYVGYQLELDGEKLPDPDAWAVLGAGTEARLVMLAGDNLFTLSHETPSGWDPQVVVTRHPAALLEVRHWREERRSYWRFSFRHRDELEVTGTFGYRLSPESPDRPDQAETFARALAATAGWQTGAPDAS